MLRFGNDTAQVDPLTLLRTLRNQIALPLGVAVVEQAFLFDTRSHSSAMRNKKIHVIVVGVGIREE